MCLSRIDVAPKKNVKRGYKVFSCNGNAKVVVHNVFRQGEYRVGRTYHDKNEGKIYLNHSKIGYPSGFHIYTRKKDALDFINSHYMWDNHKDHVLHEVTFDNIVASGMERFRKVIVARTITIGERIPFKLLPIYRYDW